RTHGRAESKIAVEGGVGQRLQPHAIAHQPCGSSSQIENGKCKHAAKPRQAADAPRLVSMQYEFRVRPVTKAISQRLEFGRGSSPVIDFAVVANPDVPR